MTTTKTTEAKTQALVERLGNIDPIEHVLTCADGWLLVTDADSRYWMQASDLVEFFLAWDHYEAPAPIIENGRDVSMPESRYDEASRFVSAYQDDDAEVPQEVAQEARDWFATYCDPIEGSVSYGF